VGSRQLTVGGGTFASWQIRPFAGWRRGELFFKYFNREQFVAGGGVGHGHGDLLWAAGMRFHNSVEVRMPEWVVECYPM
jgi:hypothetical protein